SVAIILNPARGCNYLILNGGALIPPMPRNPAWAKHYAEEQNAEIRHFRSGDHIKPGRNPQDERARGLGKGRAARVAALSVGGHRAIIRRVPRDSVRR